MEDVTRFGDADEVKGASPQGSGRLIGKGSRWFLYLAATGLVWVSFLRTPLPMAEPPFVLDGAFYQAYGYCLKHNLQAGRDYVFTFGPLGYFYRSAYDADLYWHVYAWQLSVKLALAVVVMQTVRRLPGVRLKLLALLAVAAPALLLEWFPDSLYTFCFLLMFANAAANDRPTLLGLVPVTLVMAVLSLVKFNFFLFIPFVIAFLSLHLWQTGRRAGAALLPGLYGLEVCALWLLLGQSLGNLPAYLRGSLELTSGYTQAYPMIGDPYLISIGGLTGLTFLAVLMPLSLSELALGRHLLSLRAVATIALLLLAAFMAWKHAFVRYHGPTHTAFFFTYTLAVLFVLPALLPTLAWKQPIRVSVLSACATLSAVGILGCLPFPPRPADLVSASRAHLAERLRFALRPGQVRAELEGDWARAKEKEALPEIRARVQGATVDLLSFEQNVLFLNQMNWRPRPVFQSHGTITPYLAALNARFYRQADAPEFVLLKVQPIDDRVPTSEDGPALLEIFRRYRPVLAERGYLLFERRNNPDADSDTPGAIVLERTVRFGEEVALGELPDGCYTLSVAVPLSPRGRVLQTAYKVPEVWIKVKTATRGESVYRLIPPMAQAGFLLSPLVTDANDVLDLYTATAGEPVLAFTVISYEPGSYQDEIGIVLQRFPRPAPFRRGAIRLGDE